MNSRMWSLIPSNGKRFSSSHIVKIFYGAQTASYSTDVVGCFPGGGGGGKTAGFEFKYSSPSGAEVKNEWNYNSGADRQNLNLVCDHDITRHVRQVT